MDDDQLAPGDEGQDEDARVDDGAADEGGQDEGREQVEAQARELGWKPKTDWKGDQTRWTDAGEFLERTKPAKLREALDGIAAKNRDLERQRAEDKRQFDERIARLDKVTQTALKRQREQLLANVKAAQRQAVETGDVEAFDQLAAHERRVAEDFDKEERELAPAAPAQKAAPQVDQTVVAWTESNPAIRHDPVKWNAAVAFFSEAERDNPEGSIADHLAHVESRLDGVWPGSVRAKKANGTANGKEPQRGPQVEGGARSAAKTGMRQKGWTDIPSDERRIIEGHISEGLYRDDPKDTIEKQRATAAKAYWS